MNERNVASKRNWFLTMNWSDADEVTWVTNNWLDFFFFFRMKSSIEYSMIWMAKTATIEPFIIQTTKPLAPTIQWANEWVCVFVSIHRNPTYSQQCAFTLWAHSKSMPVCDVNRIRNCSAKRFLAAQGPLLLVCVVFELLTFIDSKP